MEKRVEIKIPVDVGGDSVAHAALVGVVVRDIVGQLDHAADIHLVEIDVAHPVHDVHDRIALVVARPARAEAGIVQNVVHDALRVVLDVDGKAGFLLHELGIHLVDEHGENVLDLPHLFVHVVAHAAVEYHVQLAVDVDEAVVYGQHHVVDEAIYQHVPLVLVNDLVLDLAPERIDQRFDLQFEIVAHAAHDHIPVDAVDFQPVLLLFRLRSGHFQRDVGGIRRAAVAAARVGRENLAQSLVHMRFVA